jgi:hypothetical protein
METSNLVEKFDKIINQFITFYRKSDDYFFTEKELHSYFYHLCLCDGSFVLNNKFNLIHTEYPTPFKCSIIKEEPYISIEDITSKHIRSHIDLVMLNPNFVEWIKQYKNHFDYLKGLRNQLFPKYIQEFISKYEQFYIETKETVLLYALEFKYFRVGFWIMHSMKKRLAQN